MHSAGYKYSFQIYVLLSITIFFIPRFTLRWGVVLAKHYYRINLPLICLENGTRENVFVL